ncbi:MAG: phenylalanine--tRNA ligase subunit beta [Catenisphaera adipataccumulans]|jgi:phenylalanyl-tRNA synthetase beta chain|uniref:phenylalanine--tRNA ligase subunit beta n=1 Tax=Catenisphaera adipataccumulans TaxID=700500 RepID=UPI003D9365BC
MLISRKWLSQYMDISDLSIEEIADRVTSAGFEVENVYKLSQGTNLVIGHVEECYDHPNSDHLHCTKVNIGSEIVPIVCGAPNVAAGQNVIVALPGAKLPGGEIKEGVIRGEASNGMICSLLELGVDPHTLSEEQKVGIEELPADAPVGDHDPLGYLGLDDEVLDISLTPNRSDCMSAFNMAVETGAILDRPVTLPDYAHAADGGKPTQLHVASETKICPHFMGKVIGKITIKESPKWMKELLSASGVHSINNVVDISNIVMLETGHPMHFYDKDAIKDQEITVKDGFDTDYTALDGVTYHLEPQDAVITNQGKPIGIAGIMGGDDSKILDTTSGLIIECANFNHVAIRNTSRRLNLNTDASIRYQKGIEPLSCQKAMDRAVQLLKEYADADEIEETVEYGSDGYRPKTVTCTLADLNGRLGTDFTFEEVCDVFKRLRFEPEANGDQIICHIPSYRTDIEGKADLSEEVIRLLGYDRLPSTLPLMEMTEGKLNPKQRMIRQTREIFTAQGLQDCITYTLVSTEKKDNAILGIKDPIELSIPISEERRWIRTSILPSLLDVVAYNHAHSIKDVNVFELSDVSATCGACTHLAFVLSGSLQSTRWLDYDVPADFYTAKGIVEEWLDRIGINARMVSYVVNKKDTEHFHPYRSAEIHVGKKCVGLLGQIHPKYAKTTDTKDVIMAEIDFDALFDVKKSKIKFKPVSKYQSVSRDISFVIKRTVPAEDIIREIRKNGKLNKENIIRDVEIFDVYEKAPLPPTVKSVALSILFQAENRTLKDQEVNDVFDQIVAALEKKFQIELRK